MSTDDTTDPLGLGDSHPTLGWQLGSRAKNQAQTAYEILVASTPALLSPGKADIWDSGEVTSADSVQVPYGGPGLRSSTRYWWKVRVWDGKGRPSPWSASAWWETALLKHADWGNAKWIAPLNPARDPWQNYTVDVDFTIKSGAAGFIFRSQDANNLYMWQITGAMGPSVLLRTHVRVNGAWNVLAEVPLKRVLTQANLHRRHHLRIALNGDTITTAIDGKKVDTRTNNVFAAGGVGFRSGDATEDTSYDNLVIRSGGKVILSDRFDSAHDPTFPTAQIQNGSLRTANGDMELMGGAIAQTVSKDVAAGTPIDSPLLRKDFRLDPSKRIRSARAYVSGLGFYELDLSGHKVSNRVLVPSATPFNYRDVYQTYDVTKLVRKGANTVGIRLAAGYGSSFSQFAWQWPGPRQAILKLVVTYADGSTSNIVTDDSWRVGKGGIVSADIYNGEHFDARLEPSGWDRPGFNDSSWQPVRTVRAPAAIFQADMTPAIDVVKTLRPKKVRRLKASDYVFDLGQDIAGWARVKAHGKRGTLVTIRYAEALNPDGTLDTYTNRGAQATDTFVLAGGGTETYEPRFTYHGFRYVEVTGAAGRPVLEGRVVHANVPSTATFETSDPEINRIYSDNLWTILDNSESYPTDGPVRDERTQPGLDVQAYQDASTTEFGMDQFYDEYLDNSPYPARKASPDMFGDPVTLAWTLYEQYGDKASLAARYDTIAEYVDSLASKAPSGIWPDSDKDGFGDWCPPLPASQTKDGIGSTTTGGYNPCFSEVSLVNTALYYLDATIAAHASVVLGATRDSAHFNALATKIAAAFNRHFGNASHTGYGDGRQVTSVLPIVFGIVPKSWQAGVDKHLAETVIKDGDHLDTGIFGTRYLVDALTIAGRSDLALAVLNQHTYPGYGFEIAHGGTTAWEEWMTLSSSEDYDHAMYAGINASLLAEFGGITPTGPGYAQIRVAPATPAGLKYTTETLHTVRGEVMSSWRRVGRVVHLTVVVPVNATAEVVVPGQAARARAGAGAESTGTQDGAATFEVGSGKWTFTGEI